MVATVTVYKVVVNFVVSIFFSLFGKAAFDNWSFRTGVIGWHIGFVLSLVLSALQ